jgi:hypothetical protein
MTSVLKLNGGIGNQLFQYFQAIHESLTTEAELTLDFLDVFLGKTNHGSTISSLRLPVECVQLNQNPNRLEIIWGRLLKSVKSKLSSRKIIDLKPQGIECQDSKYFDLVLKKIPDWSPILYRYSDWYIKVNSLAEKTKFISVHIRRGDYAHPRNSKTIGLLDLSYYLHGINQIQSKLGVLPVWLFCDDPEYVIKIMPLMPKNCRLILAPRDSDPAESLLIMSKARGLVLSNSTFSWWGARFAEENTLKVVPSPWFKNLEQPTSLIPKTWESLESIWENEPN